MRSRSKLPRSAIALAASLGTMPASARVRLDATSTCSQQRNLFSSLQIRPISGRVYRGIKGAPSDFAQPTFDDKCPSPLAPMALLDHAAPELTRLRMFHG